MTITIADGRGALWQWDTGRRVKITDGDGVKQVHYQNRCFGRSVDVDVGADGTAIIPDELLQDWHPLTAYAYVNDDAGGYTKVQVDFAVHKRAKPADYVYTPTEHAGFDRLRAEIGDLADLTTEAKDTLVAAINEAARTGGGAGSMDLRVADGYIQYSTDSGSTWQNLIAVAELKGADGGKGDPGAAGQDGHSPVVTATKSGKTTTISVDGADIATVEDGVDGKPGAAGSDGITPTIGANGNWYLGATDTGKPSRGEKGDTDHTPVKGTDYWTASDKAEIVNDTKNAIDLSSYAKLSDLAPLYGTTSQLTPAQVHDAVIEGTPVVVQYLDDTYGFLSFTTFNIAESLYMIVSQTIVYYNSVYILAELSGAIRTGIWAFNSTVLAEKKDIPTVPSALKNPNALTIKIGSTTVTYDGSAAKTVEIADGSEVSY